MTDRLTGHDQAFLGDSSQPAVGALVMVERSDDHEMTLEHVERLISSRLHLLPRHRQVPVFVPGAGPRWVDDPSFDIAKHLRRGDGWVAVDALHREDFPPGRPPWDATLIGRGEAVYLRWHHAMVDGMSAIAIGRVLFDRTATAPDGRPLPWSPAEASVEDLVAEAGFERIVASTRSAWDQATAWLDPLEKLESDVAFLDGWLDIHDRVSIGVEPGSGISRFTTVDNRDQADLRSRSKAFPGGVEGVAVTTLAIAVADLHRARGSPLDERPFRVLVPVARPRRDREVRLGNAASFYLLDVPLGLSALATGEAIDEQIRRVRPLHTQTVDQMMDWLDLLPSGLVAMLSGAAARTQGIDAIVSYVRGPRVPLWFAGFPHLGTYSSLPTSAAVPLSLGHVALGGRATMSLSAADGVYPEIDFLASRLRASFEALPASR